MCERLDDYEFALCLTHDVDRPYKTFQAPYYAVKDQDPTHLLSLLSSKRPYWQFEEIMELEEELGVRSTFFFLNEQRLFQARTPREWVNPKNWKIFTGRYDITDEDIVDVIQTLDHRGWEVGLHGSYDSYKNKERLKYEKEQLEKILSHSIAGCRQHYLNLHQPKTWEYQREIGLEYDASLGSSSQYGFQHGDDIIQPFDDEFVVFPLTIMEIALLNKEKDITTAKSEISKIIDQAADLNAVMTVLWHPRVFNENEFPGYKELYRHLISEAKRCGGIVGSIEEIRETMTKNI